MSSIEIRSDLVRLYVDMEKRAPEFLNGNMKRNHFGSSKAKLVVKYKKQLYKEIKKNNTTESDLLKKLESLALEWKAANRVFVNEDRVCPITQEEVLKKLESLALEWKAANRVFVNEDRVCPITQEAVPKDSGVIIIIKDQEGQKNWIFDRDSLIKWFKTQKQSGSPIINPATRVLISSESIIDEKTNNILDPSEYELENDPGARASQNAFTEDYFNELGGLNRSQRDALLRSDYARDNLRNFFDNSGTRDNSLSWDLRNFRSQDTHLVAAYHDSIGFCRWAMEDSPVLERVVNPLCWLQMAGCAVGSLLYCISVLVASVAYTGYKVVDKVSAQMSANFSQSCCSFRSFLCGSNGERSNGERSNGERSNRDRSDRDRSDSDLDPMPFSGMLGGI